jgi:hypothetical protein
VLHFVVNVTAMVGMDVLVGMGVLLGLGVRLDVTVKLGVNVRLKVAGIVAGIAVAVAGGCGVITTTIGVGRTGVRIPQAVNNNPPSTPTKSQFFIALYSY